MGWPGLDEMGCMAPGGNPLGMMPAMMPGFAYPEEWGLPCGTYKVLTTEGGHMCEKAFKMMSEHAIHGAMISFSDMQEIQMAVGMGSQCKIVKEEHYCYVSDGTPAKEVDCDKCASEDKMMEMQGMVMEMP